MKNLIRIHKKGRGQLSIIEFDKNFYSPLKPLSLNNYSKECVKMVNEILENLKKVQKDYETISIKENSLVLSKSNGYILFNIFYLDKESL